MNINLDKLGKFKGGIGICSCICLVILPILINSCFLYVRYDQYALPYNTVSRVVDSQVLDPGAHFVGLSTAAHVYPSRWLNLEFSHQGESNAPLIVRAEDGQQLQIDASVQYQIIKEEVKGFYDLYLQNYEPALKKTVQNIARDVGILYAPQDFFYNRTVIESRLKTELEEKFRQVHVTMQALQVRKIVLPTSLSSRLSRIQLTKQETRLAEESINLLSEQAETNKLLKELETLQAQTQSEVQLQTENLRLGIYSQEVALTEETKRELNAIRAELNDYLIQYRQETENQRLTLVQEAALIAEETNKAVAEITANSADFVALYEKETQNLQQAIYANRTLIEATTAATIKALEADIVVNTAAQNKVAAVARATAAASGDILVTEAQEVAAQARSEVVGTALAALKDDVGLTSDHILLKQWLDTFDALAPSQGEFLDMTTPAALKSYENATGA